MIDAIIYSVFILASSFGTLLFVKVAGKVFYLLAIDSIELFTRWHTAKLDNETRRAKLDYWQDYAHVTLQERRAKLLEAGEK